MTTETVQMPTQETPTVANSDTVSLQISLPQLLDLALGSPEVGAVNFKILHNFLHVLLHQINLQSTKVEYRGEEADRIKTMVTTLKPKTALHEYSITNGVGKVLQRVRNGDGVKVDVLTEDTPLPSEEDLKVTRGVLQQVDSEKENDTQTVVFVEPVVNGVPPTALAFKELEQSVKQLRQQYQTLEDLSTTPEVVERLKGRITDPVADVWQFININKRLDANEQGIDKLTTMIQDVIKGDVDRVAIEDTSLINARLDMLENKIIKMEQQLIDLQSIATALIEDTLPADDNYIDISAAPIKAEAPETAATDEVIVPLREKVETITERETIETPKTPKTVAEKLTAPRTGNAIIAEIRQDIAILKRDVAQIQRELKYINEKVIQGEIPSETIMRMPSVQKKPVVTEATEDKEMIGEIKDITNLEQCVEAMKNVETTHGNALHNITERVVILEAEVELLLEKLDTVQETGRIGDVDINELVAKIRGIETDMEKIEQTMNRMLDDKEERETHINTLLEQIEVLKIIKADKEDLEDALADKADAQAVNRKVSHDQFDAACDDLTHGLEEAIDKLTKQESIWQQTLDEVQNEIASKVDKIEMTPLKNFVTNKLKSLQEKLKIMAEARREIEAAGTKKLLRDVQCISCDKNVVMKREEVGKFHAEALPCTTSIKPYLTYELDQVRKQQRKLPRSRNMIQFEAAMQEEARKMKAKEEMPAKTPRDHLCNRYCGGSHTITTPQQRVMRVGHFLTQWGPETIQLTDGLIKGKDGQMYRSRLLPTKMDVCGPACWESQISEETRPLLSQERAPSAPTSLRKSLPSRRNSAGNQNRNAKRPSKELKISEPEEKPIDVEVLQMTPPQENDDRPLVIPSSPQDDKVMLYDTNEIMMQEE